MKILVTPLRAALASLLLLISPLSAAPPDPVLGFQGRLVDPATGNNKADGIYSTTFRLYDLSVGGAAAWTETLNVQLEKGYFSVLLGQVSPIDPADIDLYNVWLGIEVSGDGEMVPRHRLSYSPYAITALTLDGGLGPSAFYRRNLSQTSTVSSSTQPTLQLTQTTDQEALDLLSQPNGAGEAALRAIAGSASATNINSASAILASSQTARGLIAISDSRDGIFGWTNDAGSAAVKGQSINGTGVSAFSQNGLALDVLGDAEISGTLTAPRNRTRSWPANSLNYDIGGALTQASDGVQYTNTFVGGTFLDIARPDDWDGTSDITMRLLFYPTTAAAGNVSFFIRPKGRGPGDLKDDPLSVSGSLVATSGTRILLEQSFTLPSSTFGTKPYWGITIQRDSTIASPYPDPVVLTVVSLDYTATR